MLKENKEASMRCRHPRPNTKRKGGERNMKSEPDSKKLSLLRDALTVVNREQDAIKALLEKHRIILESLEKMMQ